MTDRDYKQEEKDLLKEGKDTGTEKLGKILYHILEGIDGEHKLKLIDYKTAERLKLKVLQVFLSK